MQITFTSEELKKVLGQYISEHVVQKEMTVTDLVIEQSNIMGYTHKITVDLQEESQKVAPAP